MSQKIEFVQGTAESQKCLSYATSTPTGSYGVQHQSCQDRRGIKVKSELSAGVYLFPRNKWTTS